MKFQLTLSDGQLNIHAISENDQKLVAMIDLSRATDLAVVQQHTDATPETAVFMTAEEQQTIHNMIVWCLGKKLTEQSRGILEDVRTKLGIETPETS